MVHKVLIAVFVFLCIVQGGFGRQINNTKEQGRSECETVRCACSGGMPGIPGANGMPGMPGPYGARGDKGNSGDEGKPGTKGDSGSQGIVGNPGSKGDKGDRGSRGQNGSPGKTGPGGAKGNKGEQGNSGTKGNAGQKGDAAAAEPISAANWKQCVWKNVNDNNDSGKIKDCSFNKLQGNTALKVSFQGNLRGYSASSGKCNRWYFKFNGNECSGPMTIEAVVYNAPYGNGNLHHHRPFEGYCENLPRGAINVELWVGYCAGYSQGDAYTGWNSVSRIMVEEVPRSQ